MYEVVYQGVDTLYVAFQGALPQESIDELSAMKDRASSAKREQKIRIGDPGVDMLLQPKGGGGYQYILTTGPTGARFMVQGNADAREWNFFVAVSAARLLTHGYQSTKIWISEILGRMGAKIIDYSVNRIDYAIDILAPDFVLDLSKVVCPARTKARAHCTETKFDGHTELGGHCTFKGGRFESVTIGKMPGRQVILYDKSRAAIDLGQPYWFDAWGLDRHDPGTQVWRVEIRAARNDLAKKVPKRSYEAVEALFPDYLHRALTEIRYVEDRDVQKNVSRAPLHPLWKTAIEVANASFDECAPPVLEAHVLDLMRKKRIAMAKAQTFGNLNNLLVLEGISPEIAGTEFPRLAAERAASYREELGEQLHFKKLSETEDRLSFLTSAADER